MTNKQGCGNIYSQGKTPDIDEEATEMKRYFVNGKEITKQEAELIEKKNNEYLNSGNMEDMLNIKFIVVI